MATDFTLNRIADDLAGELPTGMPPIADNNVLFAPVTIPPPPSISNPSIQSQINSSAKIINIPDVNRPLDDTPSTVPQDATKPTKLPGVPSNRVLPPTSKTPQTIKDLEELKTIIQELEIQTNLNLLPYFLFGGELARIKHQFSDLNINKYFLLLKLLVEGFDNTEMSAQIGKDHAKYVIDDNFIKDFQRMIKIPQLSEILKKTPAYAKGCFDGIGQLGNIEANGDRRENNAMSGPNRFTPSLVTNAMEKILPGSVNNIESLCNKIRTRAYLSMPSGAFGSIRRVINIINGVTVMINTMLNDFYKKMNEYIRKAYAIINNEIEKIKRFLFNQINKIIPLDFVCLILDTIQVMLDDINFFCSLFNASGTWLNYLNTIQTYVNTISDFVQDPFDAAFDYLPPEVSTYYKSFKAIGKNPEEFISDQLTNHGLSYINTALQGDIVGAMMEKYGNRYSANGTSLSIVMSKAKAIWERYSADGSTLPDIEDVGDLMDSNYYNGGTVDALGNPKDPYDIVANLKQNFKTISMEVSGLKTDLPKDLGKVGDFFNSLNPFKDKDDGLTDTPNPNQQKLPAT